jgi:hypothetical protein
MVNRKLKKPMKKSIVIVKKDLSFIEKVKNFIYFLGVLGVGFIIIYGLAQFGGWIDEREVNKIKANKSEVVGKIIDVGYLKGSYAVAEYYVNNIRYERRDFSPADDIYKKEHYIIIYDSLSPFESRIDFSRPIFKQNSKTSTTKATVTNRDWLTVKFTYFINGVEYTRFQKKLENNKKIKDGEIFEVEYLLSNPNVAILKIK